uniref:Uncharacterized protein n=1 Tax=Caenorhabditis japonica TaxID=281687 RepID=A0A8R1DM10_CAEJA
MKNESAIQGINLIYTYGTYSYSTGVDFNPPYTMDNKSLAYLDKIIINGLHIKPVVDTTKKTEALADMEHLLDQFAMRHPEITHVTFGNPTAYIDDSAKPESLCNLNDLNLLGNPLDEQDWISEEIFLNLNLDRLRLGEPQSMTSVPHSLVAFMRTSSQVMYSSTLSLNQVHTYKYKIGCVYDTISSATMFGYRLQNGSCEEEVDMAIEKIRDLEIKKMESNCE